MSPRVPAPTALRRLAVLGLAFVLAGCVPPEPPGRKYLVFFQDWSAELDSNAKTTLDQAAGQAAASPSQQILVAGFADPDGTPQENREISRLRAQMVTDTLVKAGVARDRIQLRARGSVAFVDTSLESRRVEVTVGKAP